MQPDQNVTATLSYSPSYLILSHSCSWRRYFWIFLRLGDPKLRGLANLWSYKLIIM